MKNILKFSGHAVLLTAVLMEGSFAQNAWINEIHYDNAGGDVNEFVEVVIQDAGSYSLADFSVILYNGGNGTSYNTKSMDQFTVGAVSEDYHLFYYIYPSNGIQNGAPDGMALAYQGNLIVGQFLSYEGTFTATNGVASGISSTDIGVSEPGTDPGGNSLQLSGTGLGYVHFSWESPAPETPGQLNNNQAFGDPPVPEPTNYPADFNAIIVGLVASLSWTDASGGQLPENYLILASDQDSIVAPEDGVMQPDDPDLSDGSGTLNVSYGTQTCVFFRLGGDMTWYFRIYPYTNTGPEVNYKTGDYPPKSQGATPNKINGNDFEDGSFGSWTAISVASDKDWSVVNEDGAYQTTHSAQMDGYLEDMPSNDWLISPSLNLVFFTGEMMEFHSEWSSGDSNNELTLKFSMDYISGNPMQASWTDLEFTKDTAAETWATSGIIDLSLINGENVHIAFQYLSSGNPRRWGIDEIEITGIPVQAMITVTSPVGGEQWERGSSHDISWTAVNNQANMRIELTTNASSDDPEWTILNPSVPAVSGSWTWEIPPEHVTSDDCRIKITDFASRGEGLSDIFSIIKSTYVPRLVITEIMYNPPESGSDTLEFMELFNDDEEAVNLEGYYFSSGINYSFPSFVLEPGVFCLLAVDSVIFEAAFGVPAFQYDGSLNNNGEYLGLLNAYDVIVDSLSFDDMAPWPSDPDGDGPSLTFCDPGLDNSVATNWSVSHELTYINADGDSLFATPGAACIILPHADFIADITVVVCGGSVNFTDLSTGDPAEWIWTFDGGTPGSYEGQSPPPITYETPGLYNVTLFISNNSGTSTEEKFDYIIAGDPPEADFLANPTNLYEGGTVDFTDLSSGSPESWSWEFEGGNPASSSVQNPAGILYSEPGTYNVTLTVTDIFGTGIVLKEHYIDVIPVGIDEQSDSRIIIYPNPNGGRFFIVNPFHEEMIASVYSLYGQLLVKIQVKPGEHSPQPANIPEGVYLIQLTSKEGNIRETARMIVY